MPSLVQKFYSQIPPKVKVKGHELFSIGAVEIIDGNPDFVEAVVADGVENDVSLTLDQAVLKVHCDCAAFLDQEKPCQHIWAAMLEAEASGCLTNAERLSSVKLVADDQFDDDQFDDDDFDDEDPTLDDSWEDEPIGQASPNGLRLYPGRPPKPAPQPTAWKKDLASLRPAPADPYRLDGAALYGAWPAGREILYIASADNNPDETGMLVEVGYRDRKKDGDWGKLKLHGMRHVSLGDLPDAADRAILAMLNGAVSFYQTHSTYDHYRLSAEMMPLALPRLAETGRLLLRPRDGGDDDDLRPLRWEADAWNFRLVIAKDASGKNYVAHGELRRGDETAHLGEAQMMYAGGIVLFADRVAPLRDEGIFPWIALMCRKGALTVPVAQKKELLEELTSLPHLPDLVLPAELRYEEVAGTPQPSLKVVLPKDQWRQHRLHGQLSFVYEGLTVPAHKASKGIYQAATNRMILRDGQAESQARDLLLQVGFRPLRYGNEPELELIPRHLPKVVRTLTAAGWQVEAEGKIYRQAGSFAMSVNSGIDWFELHGTVKFGDESIGLPKVLEALKRGDGTVTLGDGTLGILPEAWLKKYGLLAGLGKAQKDHVRFGKAQVGLLDALLASQPETTFDLSFQKARAELGRFDGIAPAAPPETFQGELRGYQKEGLGWLTFLERFGFGGCLADDMGLGKTVQVLALLATRLGQKKGPSLVVVPRSLVFNWQQEAARFAPKMRVLDHTGLLRSKDAAVFHDHDLVLTTYGTLRRDILLLKDVTFDFCILDESQAIKNSASESAKAARLLQADHRLALSGTPVENHLGELWSLFEFLNPGMLGASSAFRLGAGKGRDPDPEVRGVLAKALRPFLLRRTKEQVAKDLPQKTEQTLFCELEAEQRQVYDELRDYYRHSLKDRIAKEGINKAKIQILEALLRLRQAACHPALIDKTKADESSAKIDVLLPQIEEVVGEGHKALVFSQFTSFLAIVRARLDRDKVAYEYLDGRTRNRQAKVDRFQNDADCKLFLISLKAGGLGLNLTAAEYVFLLDPWWNPAVEAQAIDRAHRIGQTRPVFAYRLIARDTVEEKVLELQKTKRALADAILNADNSLITDLRAEDLEMLLS